MSMSAGSKSEINVTPMIDVLLVLLIIFMVIQPTTPRGLDTSLPQSAKATAPSTPEAPVVLDVAAAGGRGVQYHLNQREIARTQLADELSRLFAARQDRVMFVKGDPKLDYSTVADVVGFAQQANVRVGLLTSRSSAEER